MSEESNEINIINARIYIIEKRHDYRNKKNTAKPLNKTG